MKAIEVKNLTFFYQKDSPLIDGLSFSINKGDYVVILGNNGSCKSTIAKLLTGIVKPISGEIYINGNKVTDNYVNPVSIVFQNPDNQFVASTVEEDIAFGLENKCVERSIMQEKVLEFAKKVHMEKYLSFEPSNLSGGQKQRVALAGVLVLDNDILILDEATSMLDPKGRNEVNSLIAELRKDNKDLTVISITHDVNTIFDGNQVIIFNNGNIAAQGVPSEVFESDDEYINSFLPFNLKFKKKLNLEGYKISSNDIEGICEELCQSK